jgi:hypothetical protein
MQPDGAHISPSDFTAHFLDAWSGARERFLKIERRQDYSQVDDESYQAFLRGDYADAISLLRQELLQQRAMYGEARASGVALVRLRQFEEPLSDYLLHYEIPSYFVSEELGEEVYFAHPDPNADELPDCIVFDSTVMFVNTYDGLGRLGGAIEVSDQEQIQSAVLLAERLLSTAEPLSSFVETHGLTISGAVHRA